ncbi:peptide-methionine (S)-S-oxide reductase MsrA [Janibacter sp. GS2]|uniref:peptide-methionine (S)-S-oxide reductase MsrA n=1 Tax=Janibacter sp. GS2 TaxID=3442646 RepID=UPI003EC06597
MFGHRQIPPMPTADTALSGRGERPFRLPERHAVLDTPLEGPWPEGTEVLYVAMGCFWGAERIFWQLEGVVATAAGYMGGFTPHPTYEETCTGLTGHTESVLVAYDPTRTRPELLLKAFWENHDPTTANRQGNDVGTQYRSAIYWTTEDQRAAVEATAAAFGEELAQHDLPQITTEMRPASEVGQFWYAEDYHQQYLHTNPGGYCNHGPNGLTCQVGILRQDEVPAQQDIAPPQ